MQQLIEHRQDDVRDHQAPGDFPYRDFLHLPLLRPESPRKSRLHTSAEAARNPPVFLTVQTDTATPRRLQSLKLRPASWKR